MPPDLVHVRLLDRPQRLGFLPSMWFWNDHARHRLVLPIVMWLSLPLTPLIFFLIVRFQLPIWLLPVVSGVWPFVVMGLVERHIRGELRRRARGEYEVGAPPAVAERAGLSSTALGRLGLALGAVTGTATVLAVAELSGVAVAAVGVAVLVLLGGAGWTVSTRLAKLMPDGPPRAVTAAGQRCLPATGATPRRRS